MAAPGRSPLPAFVAMALVAVAVVLGVNAISSPAPDPTPTSAERPPTTSAAPIVEGFGSTIERDFLPTVLGRPHVSAAHRYCDERGCCPTWRTTFGTTTETDSVIATLRSQGFATAPGDRDVVRPGPFVQVSWTGVLGAGARRTWRRVDVARGTDVDRPAWPTVFVQSSVACRAR
jgi:hypothetical protein